MNILTIKDTDYKLFLAQAWTSLDEDIFLKNTHDRVFKLIAIYFIEDYKMEDYKNDSYFYITSGEINLDNIIKEDIFKSVFDIYGWRYDFKNKKIITDDKTFDKE